jgi:hypothetical protein
MGLITMVLQLEGVFNRWRGTWRHKNNAWIYQSSTIRSNHIPDQGGMEAVGTNGHNSLEWMDACDWYQLATLFSQSYYMVVGNIDHTERGGESM